MAVAGGAAQTLIGEAFVGGGGAVTAAALAGLLDWLRQQPQMVQAFEKVASGLKKLGSILDGEKTQEAAEEFEFDLDLKDAEEVQRRANYLMGVLERQMEDSETEAATETASELQALWEQAFVKPSFPLILMNSTVSDVSPLANLTGLEYLDLRRTQVTDVSMLSHIQGLKIFMPVGVPDNRT